ncbi:Ribonuclease/ribotoxin [Ampelomyces quisqualis]|uniref:ribonuclease T1 n=1 Tax=Ampelomyces quisqualis TaxID=50730 RepID=A0A6A5QZU5_AMPQU|nr:Ribonuclease/ribotoxin [Ampelomyces quisqualis]
MKFILSFLLLLTPVALALPTLVVTEVESPIEAEIEARQCYVQCGSTCYTSSQVSAARSAGYNYYRQGNQAGSSNYPHTYNNYEGFDFLVNGPYQEFPLRTSGTFTAGSPGADRVIFNTAGQRAGEITHTGASGNNFVACSGW